MRRAVLIAVLLLGGCGTMNRLGNRLDRLGERVGNTWDSIRYHPLMPSFPSRDPRSSATHDPYGYERHRALVFAACAIAAAFDIPISK